MNDSPLHQRLWAANLDLANACLEHPFVRGLGDGTLPSEVFGRYVAQDVFYLEAFFRAYALAAARCEGRHDAAVAFHRLMGGVLQELEMHAGHAARLGLDLEAVTPHPATSTYVDLLLDVAWHRGLGETIAVMTPCMRLYAFLGAELAGDLKPGHPYRGWIETYSGPDMEQLAATMEGLLDELTRPGPEASRLYRRAMECELAFFDAPFDPVDHPAGGRRRSRR
jgi:thiaminase/transcriptional activator TenA